MVDGDELVHQGIKSLVERDGLHVVCTKDPKEAVAMVKDKYFTACLIDLDTPELNHGIQTIEAIRKLSPLTSIVALSSRKSFGDSLEAIRHGAIDVVVKVPDSVQYLREILLQGANQSVHKREIDGLWNEVDGLMDQFLKLLLAAEKEALRVNRNSGANSISEVYSMLFASPEPDFSAAVVANAPKELDITVVSSGGEVLDKGSSGSFDLILLADHLFDLPTNMLIETIQKQATDAVIVTFSRPGHGDVCLIDKRGSTPVISPFSQGKQLVDKLPELAAALAAKHAERRTYEEFRQKHYDFLRRYAQTHRKVKIASKSV